MAKHSKTLRRGRGRSRSRSRSTRRQRGGTRDRWIGVGGVLPDRWTKGLVGGRNRSSRRQRGGVILPQATTPRGGIPHIAENRLPHLRTWSRA